MQIVPEPSRLFRLVLRLIVGLALLGWPRVGSAQGNWSVMSLPLQPGEPGRRISCRPGGPTKPHRLWVCHAP